VGWRLVVWGLSYFGSGRGRRRACADAALDLGRVADPVSASGLDAKIAALLQQSKPAPADVAALLAEVEAALVKVGDELACTD
jgi:hypothetical protein